MENPGILSVVDLEDDEFKVFLDYLYALKDSEHYDVLYSMYGKEGLLKFLDVFSGDSVKVPKRSYLNKIIKKIKIYMYCLERDFSDESIRMASKIFDKRKSSVQRAIDKIERVLDKKDMGDKYRKLKEERENEFSRT